MSSPPRSDRSESGYLSLEQLIGGVQDLLEAGRTRQVAEYLNAARLQPESLAPYLRFESGHYTRNLIHKHALFEMMALCWEAGQRSWIHNHRGQHCWMAVTQGKLALRNYQRLGCHQQLRTVQLKPAAELLIFPGSGAEVDPDEPLHEVWNPAEINQPAISLHVYSRPFASCVAYDTEQGLCRDIQMFYTSQYGVLTSHARNDLRLADQPACVCALSSTEQRFQCGAIPPV